MISCSDYDYIEIVCMYRYPITLSLANGESVSGIALDTTRDEHKRECIKIELAEQTRLVILDDIKRLDVDIDNPHFQTKSFA